jgi:hypothetical protein
MVLTRLGWADLLGLEPFGTALDHEGHASTFVQGAISTGFYSRKMHEHIFAVLALDKAKTFSGVKPLYCTCLFHIFSLLLFVAVIEARMALKWTVTRRSPLIAPHPPKIVALLMSLHHYRQTLWAGAYAPSAGLASPYAFRHGRLPFVSF